MKPPERSTQDLFSKPPSPNSPRCQPSPNVPRWGPWLALFLTVAMASVAPAQGLFDRLGIGKKKTSETSALTSAALAGLSETQVASGLKEALAKGVEAAVGRLGATDGFLKDAAVRIPMPENLLKVERALRRLKQDALADQFVTTLNRAAEQAVPEAAAVLGDSLKQMTLQDAKAILVGTNNAATAYFRRTSSTNLHERFLPIVKRATEQTGVTRVYKQMLDQVQGGALGGFGKLGAGLLGVGSVDLDAYVTGKSLEGLFLKIGDEERRIRESAAARTTDLLQQVFGAVQQKVGSARAR